MVTREEIVDAKKCKENKNKSGDCHYSRASPLPSYSDPFMEQYRIKNPAQD